MRRKGSNSSPESSPEKKRAVAVSSVVDVPGAPEVQRLGEEVYDVRLDEGKTMAWLMVPISSTCDVGVRLEWRRLTGCAANDDGMKQNDVLEVGDGERSVLVQGIEETTNVRDVPVR
jgi:hypothetical protein